MSGSNGGGSNAIDLTEFACKKHDLQRDHRSILQYYWRELLFPFMTRRHFCLISHRWSSTTIFPSDPWLPLLLSALSIKEYNVLTVGEEQEKCSTTMYQNIQHSHFDSFLDSSTKYWKKQCSRQTRASQNHNSTTFSTSQHLLFENNAARFLEGINVAKLLLAKLDFFKWLFNIVKKWYNIPKTWISVQRKRQKVEVVYVVTKVYFQLLCIF